MSHRRRDEPGFTLVEVVIAAFIVTIVLGGAIYFVTSAGKSSQQGLVRQYMASTADRVSQELRANPTAWMPAKGEQCCTAKLGKLFPADELASVGNGSATLNPTKGNPAVTVLVGVSKVNSEGDNDGTTDLDNQRVDLYRATITVQLAQQEVAKWGESTFQPISFSTTLDPSATGLPTGSLDLQVCRVLNQTDERMAVNDCDANTRLVAMDAQPDCGTRTKNNQYVLSCNEAFNAAKKVRQRGDYYGSVAIRAERNVKFTLTRDNSDGKGSFVRTQALADSGMKLQQAGIFRFGQLPAGTYDLEIKRLPSRTEHWPSRSLPQGTAGNRMRLVVHANERSSALMLLRPVQNLTGNRHTVHLSRTIYITTLGTRVTYESGGGSGGIGDDAYSYTTTTKITHLVPIGFRAVKVDGPSWSGNIFMIPKPAGRYFAPGSKEATKFFLPRGIEFKQLDGGKTAPGTQGKVTFDNLPTGLMSRPTQIMGINGLKSQFEGPLQQPYPKSYAGEVLGRGGDFVWIGDGTRLGRPVNTETTFHDALTGECYVDSDVPGWTANMRYVGTAGSRCDTTMSSAYLDTHAFDFSKGGYFNSDRQQMGSGDQIIYVEKSMSCSQCSGVGGSNGGATPSTGGVDFPTATTPAGGKLDPNAGG